jgi:hypothetical protein
MAVELDDVLNQSFLEDQARYNSAEISTSENGNVNKLFSEVQLIKTDCNICYQDNSSCIQCYQCELKYCSDCLSKIISEFGKCSACQVDYKNNYAKLKLKNKRRPAPPPPNSNSNSKSNSKANAKANNKIHAKNLHNNIANNNRNNVMSAIDDEMMIIENLINSLNVEDDKDDDMLLTDYDLQISMICEIENKSSKSSNQNNKNNQASNNNKNNQASNNNNNNNNTKNQGSASSNNFEGEYLDNFIDDEIEPCQFQTIKPNSKYNFIVNCDQINKILIYTPTKVNICPIVIYYQILDTDFQRTLFIHLVELIDKHSKFINAWQTISDLINNFTNNYIFNTHEMNKKKRNPTFIYQKQDLLNTIMQIVS